LKKPLAALLLSAATVAALAVPAGAAPSKDWTVQVIPCRVGHKSAVLASSPTHPYWVYSGDRTGSGVVNPHGWRTWYSNPCRGQWLTFWTWEGDASPDSTLYWSVAPGKSGRAPGAGGATQPLSGTLADAAFCDIGGADYMAVVKPGQPDPCIGHFGTS
jgi:hypothetical protein